MTDTASSTIAVREDFALHTVDAWWRAANYLTVGEIYLREPLQASDIRSSRPGARDRGGRDPGARRRGS